MPPTPSYPLAAQPKREIFDAWNSSSTGHQRAENRLSGSTSWRSSRTLKLASQFSAGAGGGARVADTVGAGSEGFVKGERTANGGWKRGVIPLEDRSGGQRGMNDYLLGSKSDITEERDDETRSSSADHAQGNSTRPSLDWIPSDESPLDEKQPEVERPKPIFAHLTFYINGSTAPLISDHKLKHLLVMHGGNLALAPARRCVTHVIVGRGAGGGLAASKLQKEIARGGAKSVRYISAEWVVESIRRGKRADERHFEGVGTRPAGVASLFGKKS